MSRGRTLDAYLVGELCITSHSNHSAACTLSHVRQVARALLTLPRGLVR